MMRLMRLRGWPLILLVSFLLPHPGCTDYGTVRDAGHEEPDGFQPDAGSDPGLDAGTDAGTDADGFDAGDCDPFVPLDSTEPGTCEDLWLPCGHTMTQMACEDDSVCPGEAPCWYGSCTAVHLSEWSVAPGCVEARIQLQYGGAAPDRVYVYDLSLPPLEHSDGRQLTRETGMWLQNPVPCTLIGDEECHIYHSPVELSYGTDGLLVDGGSGFTLLKLRDDPPDPLGPNWVASEELLELYFGARFDSPGSEPLEWFQSEFTADLFIETRSCVIRTTYRAILVPEDSFFTEAFPSSRSTCP